MWQIVVNISLSKVVPGARRGTGPAPLVGSGTFGFSKNKTARRTRAMAGWRYCIIDCQVLRRCNPPGIWLGGICPR